MTCNKPRMLYEVLSMDGIEWCHCMTSLKPQSRIPCQKTAGMGRAMDNRRVCVCVSAGDHHQGARYKRCPLLGDFTVLKNVTSFELIGGGMWHLFILISHLHIHDLPTKYSRENFCTYKISTRKNLRLTNSHEEKFWTHELSTRKKFWTHEIHTQKKCRPTKAWWHGDTMTQTHHGRRPTHVI